jgi:nucleoside 2-deoxyribosyltransferase
MGWIESCFEVGRYSMIDSVGIIYFVGPGAIDPDAEQKRDFVAKICEQRKLKAFIPQYANSQPYFDLASEKIVISGCRAAIVDLSYERPSCYYELGLVECLGADAMLIARIGTTIHQTSLRASVHYYRDLSEYMTLVKRIIESAVVL